MLPGNADAACLWTLFWVAKLWTVQVSVTELIVVKLWPFRAGQLHTESRCPCPELLEKTRTPATAKLRKPPQRTDSPETGKEDLVP